MLQNMSLVFWIGGLAILLLWVGGILWYKNVRLEGAVMGFFRSKVAAVVVFGGALVWFLYNISQLGEADFGQYKGWLLIIFGIVGLGAFKWVNEFLSVRGVAILVLMSARVLLDAAYMHTGHGIVFFVSFIYVMILLSLYLGALPYRARDLAKWFFADVKRVRVLGLVLAGYGLLLLYATISLTTTFL